MSEAFPDQLSVFRQDRKRTWADVIDDDPNDWEQYVRKSLHEEQIGILRGRIESLEAINADLVRAIQGQHDFTMCRKCGTYMKRGFAIEQTYVGGMPDFAGDTYSSTFSAGGTGKVISC
jgi:hypothetical protein